MLQKIKIIFLLFIVCNNFANANAKAIEPTVGKSLGCQLEVNTNDKMLTSQTLFKCNNTVYKSEQLAADLFFVRWETIKTKKNTFALIYFTKGAHGEKVIVYNHKMDRIITEFTSSWPIEVEQDETPIRLKFTGDSNEKNEYPPKYYTLE